MAAADRLDELVSLWQERRRQGIDVAANELAGDYPELLPELQRQIEQLRRLDRLAEGGQRTASYQSSDTDTRRQSPSSFPTPPPTIPGYEILEELGRGGMGVVYKARDTALNRLAAVKVVRDQATVGSDALARFRSEAEAVARLQHPHVVQIYSWGETEGQPYFVLEYLPGGSLAGRLDNKPQEPRAVARLVMLLARAVHAAHQASVVHRDLKPANVMLAPDADEPALNSAWGVPKVCDFGLARRTDITGPAQTATGSVMGTPRYMAPEQADGQRVGAAADVWALGVMLYEMLTGRPPFGGTSFFDTLLQVRSQEPEPPHQLHTNVPAALETVCLRCLRKSPADRFPSAAALADDLRRYLDGEAVTPVKVPSESTTRSRVSRRLVLAAVTFGVLLLAALTVSVWNRRGPELPALRGSIDLRVWEDGNLRRQGLRLHQVGALPLKAGDKIATDIQLNRPAYLYIVYLASDGQAYPVFPWTNPKTNEVPEWTDWPANEQPRADLVLPPSPLEPSPTGVETLMLLARDTPLPRDLNLPSLFAGLPVAKSTYRAVWFENGEVKLDDAERGPLMVGQTATADDPVRLAQSLLRERVQPYFTYTRAVSYLFQGR